MGRKFRNGRLELNEYIGADLILGVLLNLSVNYLTVCTLKKVVVMGD